MKQKEYPKAVVLRKSILLVVIVCVSLIASLILHNLYQSSQVSNANRTKSSRDVQSVASQSDISWYQNQSIRNNNLNKNPRYSQNTNDRQSINLQTTSQTNASYQSSPQKRQEVIKAMSASITTNQLVAENIQNVGTTSAQNLNHTNPSNNNDQNMQNEKLGFVDSAQTLHDDYLSSTLQNPLTQFELQAGTIIPGILVTGIVSDLPGQIIGQVRSNVYDSISGKYLLIPQGSKITGLYDSQIAYGQERVLVVWKRIIFPNGQSIDLQGMPGVDMTGYAGFNDQVNNHYTKIFGSVILMSVISAGAQLSQPQNSSNPWQAPSVGQTLAQSLGTNISNTATMITAKNINIQPTLEIRQGYEFNISVTKDIIFSHQYEGQ